MRPILTKITVYLMLAVVFTVSTGMGFVEHTCLMKDQRTVALEKRKGCCADKKACDHKQAQDQQTVSKKPCCEDRTVYVHVDFEAFGQKVKYVFATLAATLVQHFVAFVQSFANTDEAAFQSGNSSPPLSGRDLLVRKSTFQI
jgi:hypothetical protein